VKQWLAERLAHFLPQLAALGRDQEAEIQQLCEAEIASWRSRPTMKSLRSLNTPMIDARNAIREQLAVTEENSWFNPRSGEREHLARRYLNFSQEEWAEMHALTEEGRQQRLEGQQLLDQPEAIVAKARQLFGSQRWEDLAVGLAVTTGRRLTEILKTAQFHPLSDWTVAFEGQLKQKAEILRPYEIPTLVEADQVMAAWQRLRSLLDCQALTNEEVESLYGEEVRTAADRHFSSLVPYRTGREENLFTHLFRAVYGTIAIWLFCPPSVNALVYLATIEGHYWVIRAKTEKQRQNYLSTLHYDDYKIGDGQGNIDGRQGIRLGEPGVKVLAPFQDAVLAQAQKKERSMKRKAAAEEPLTVKATKTGYSMLRPKQGTALRILAIARERDLVHHDEVLSLLADTYRLYGQMQELLQPLQEDSGTTTPLETLKAVLAAGGQRPVEVVLDDYLQTKWRASLSELTALFEQAAVQGDEKPLTSLREHLIKRTNYQQGPLTRQKRYDEMDFTTLTLAELKALRIPAATTERFRRAVAAIMLYNQAATHELDRWFIRAKEVKELVGGRGELIAEYLKQHQAEITAHHQTFGLTEKYNNKPFPITHALQLEGSNASAE
jgi:telomere resolvase